MDKRYSASQQLMIGEEGTTRRWTIAAPYGNEVLSIIASSEALFQTREVDLETTEDYYQRLSNALNNHQTATIAADSFIISTLPQAADEATYDEN
jgi:hypothetical protein